MRTHQDIEIWKNISYDQWTNWRWQINNSIDTLNGLEKVIRLSDSEIRGINSASKTLKMRISPHIISLMDPDNPSDPLRLQFVPSEKELVSKNDSDLFENVNADDDFSPEKGLVHRYPTKVLILPTNYCGSFCRYCFRRKYVEELEETLNEAQIIKIINYIRADKKIDEVIFSGGDPLVLSNRRIEDLLESIKSISHVQIVRFHTRIPITIPYRINQDLIDLLLKYKKRFPIYFVIHVDTINEISQPFRDAIEKLVDNGFPCLASCPLLKGINDNAFALRSLWTELVKMRIKPYYLFHSDPVRGLRHFLVPIEKGLGLIQDLYDRMSGLALPQYCFNAPGGGGHVLLCPSYVTKLSDKTYRIVTFEGEEFTYSDNYEE